MLFSVICFHDNTLVRANKEASSSVILAIIMMIMVLLKCHACDDDGNSDNGHYSCFVLTPHQCTNTAPPPVHTFESSMLLNGSTCTYQVDFHFSPLWPSRCFDLIIFLCILCFVYWKHFVIKRFVKSTPRINLTCLTSEIAVIKST